MRATIRDSALRCRRCASAATQPHAPAPPRTDPATPLGPRTTARARGTCCETTALLVHTASKVVLAAGVVVGQVPACTQRPRASAHARLPDRSAGGRARYPEAPARVGSSMLSPRSCGAACSGWRAGRGVRSHGAVTTARDRHRRAAAGALGIRPENSEHVRHHDFY